MWTDTLSVILRALSFIALFQAAGIAIFLSVWGAELKVTAAPLQRLGLLSSVLAVLLLVGQYLLEAARMSGELAGMTDPALQGVVLHSAASVALSWRLLGLLLLGVSFRSRGSPAIASGIVGVVMLLAAFTFVGHTLTAPQRWLLSPVLIAHLGVVAFWFGSLAPLALVSARESPGIAARVVEQFSARALWPVTGLLLAGLLLAGLLLPSLAALRTRYSALLGLKLLGFLVLMGFAALNKYRLGPALGRGDATAGRHFRLSLAAEYLLLAAVLCTTAVLTTFYSPEA